MSRLLVRFDRATLGGAPFEHESRPESRVGDGNDLPRRTGAEREGPAALYYGRRGFVLSGGQLSPQRRIFTCTLSLLTTPEPSGAETSPVIV
jgi:hypothetical protein